MIYQHPLAYVLGIEGAALLRAFSGEFDRAFVEQRITEMRHLLDQPEQVGEAVELSEVSTAAGYRTWAPSYDQPGNGLIDVEQPIVRDILDALPIGAALDAACGTGRHSAYLAQRGHQVIGVDNSPDMLAIARERLPHTRFHQADLHDLPVPDDSVDLVICALALTHLPSLGPAFAEFVRVLRPGGHLVISDGHSPGVYLAPPPTVRLSDGRIGYLPTFRHQASDYLAAALPLGLQVRRCEQPLRPPAFLAPDEPTVRTDNNTHNNGDDEPWPWGLPGKWCREAARAAFTGMPMAIIWHFQLTPKTSTQCETP